MYTYKANVTKVYDGDTITCDIDCGFNVWLRNEKIRLQDINAPELRGEEREAGLLSRDFLRELVLNQEVILNTKKDKKGKYGRYIAGVMLDKGHTLVNINMELVKNKHAVIKHY